MSTATAEPPVAQAEDEVPAPPPAAFAFRLPHKIVREALRTLSALIPKGGSTLPILRCVHVARTIGVTRFTATNLDCALTVTILSAEPVPASALGRKLLASRHAREDGELCLDHSRSMDLRAASFGDITFTHETVEWELNGSTISDPRLLAWPPSEFPSPPVIDGDAIALAPSVLEAIEASLEFASSDETRFVLIAVLLEPDEDPSKHGHIVATDGRRIIVTRLPLPLTTTILVPLDAATLLSRQLKNGPLSIRLSENAVRFDAAPFTLHTKLVDGNYPNWRQVIPSRDKGYHIEIHPSHLEQLAATVPKLPRRGEHKEHDAVVIRLRGGTLRCSTIDTAHIELPVLVHSQPPPPEPDPDEPDNDTPKAVTVCLNRSYLLTCLRLGLRHWQIIDGMSAVTFATSQADAERLVVVMPLRVS